MPFAIKRHMPKWAEIYLEQALAPGQMRFLSTRGNKLNPHVPEWASQEHCLRFAAQGLALYKKQKQFPLLTFTSDLLMSDDLKLRRFAHSTLVKVFKVDHGFSEERVVVRRWDETTKWLKPWDAWVGKTYGEGLHEVVPWPEK